MRSIDRTKVKVIQSFLGFFQCQMEGKKWASSHFHVMYIWISMTQKDESVGIQTNDTNHLVK
jgi:hypothetical protein